MSKAAAQAKEDNPPFGGISQAEDAGFSEKFSEKRRGRPRLIDGGMVRVIQFAASDPNATPRSLQNKFYQLRAIRVLGLTVDDDCPDAFRWLWNPDREAQTCKARWTILAELGRIEGDDSLQSIARQICEMKPKARDAVSMIRRARTGKVAPTDVLQLTNEIIRVINDYTQRHPETTDGQVSVALENVRSIIEDVQ